MDLKESYSMAVSRAKLSLYESKLLVHAVQSGQNRIAGLALSREREMLEHTYKMVELVVPISDLIEAGGHYEHVVTAAQRLSKRTFEWRDDRGNWIVTPWIMRAEHRAKSGVIKIIIDKRFYDCLYNFAYGYTHYDMARCLSFKVPASYRLYPLINTQRHTMTYSIDGLKKLLGVEDKYKKTNDFIRKVIVPCHKELKESGEGNYFEYNYKKEGQKIVALNITTVWRATDMEKQASPHALRSWLPDDFFKLLIQHAGFTPHQLARNKQLFDNLTKHVNGMHILLQVIESARRNRPVNMQGYIINAIKSEIKK